jgi:plasmid stabilization system protein ParE
VRRLAFTASAERELEAIGDYIALENPARAGSFVRELRKDCALLTTMPERHPLLPRYRNSGIRRRVYGRYLIFYRIEEHGADRPHPSRRHGLRSDPVPRSRVSAASARIAPP